MNDRTISFGSVEFISRIDKRIQYAKKERMNLVFMTFDWMKHKWVPGATPDQVK